jgi:hypothetical protein
LWVDTNISEKHSISILRAEVSLKHQYLPASPHIIKTQKINIDIFTAVGIWNVPVQHFIRICGIISGFKHAGKHTQLYLYAFVLCTVKRTHRYCMSVTTVCII